MSTTRHRSQLSAVILLIAAGFISLSARTVPGQTSELPSPGPEHKKLESRLGKWKYAGEVRPSPFGPAGKFVGEETYRMILNGFFCESRWKDSLAEGVTLMGYDSVKKVYVDYSFESDGHAKSGVVTIDGNTWTSISNRTDAQGQTYQTRWVSTVSDDGLTSTGKAEYSADEGKTWQLYYDLKSTKVTD